MYVEPPYTSRQPNAAHAHAQKPEHSPNPSTCHFLELSSIAPLNSPLSTFVCGRLYVDLPYTSLQPNAAQAHAQKPEHSPNPSTCHFLELSPIVPMEALSLKLLKASAVPPAGQNHRPTAGRRPPHHQRRRAAHQLQHLLERGDRREHTPQTPSTLLNPSTCQFPELSSIAPWQHFP
jgi:hypothetical protein